MDAPHGAGEDKSAGAMQKREETRYKTHGEYQVKTAKSYARRICTVELLSTQALFTPVKTLFLLHFLMQNEDITFFKFLFTFASFVLELPSGYFSDRFGNKRAALLSRIFAVAAIACNCLAPRFWGFAASNLIWGLSDAWDSGAKDSYFLWLCRESGMQYEQLKVRIAKYSYLVNFALMMGSSLLYGVSIYLPFALTAGLFSLSAAILLTLPGEARGAADTAAEHPFSDSTRRVVRRILGDRPLLAQMAFTVTCTSLLITNFEFYTPLLQQAGVPVGWIGTLFASFMFLNMLGVWLYEKRRLAALCRGLLLAQPFSFLLVVSGAAPLVLVGAFLQELCFSYCNMNFSVYVLGCIDDLRDSSYFQSTVSFLNVVLRMALTLGATALFKYLPMGAVYGVFAAVTLGATLAYFGAQRKEKRDHADQT